MNSFINSSLIQFTPVHVTFLEMHAPPAKSIIAQPGIRFELLPKPISVSEYRRFYYSVGEKWNWLDRMVMPEKELLQKVNAINTEIFILYVNNEPAGFAEFVKEKAFTEIQYFGLLPAFIGKGLGIYFLQWVIQQAWTYQPQWIQVNTCTLDHPGALRAYLKTGFKIIHTEIQDRRVLVKE